MGLLNNNPYSRAGLGLLIAGVVIACGRAPAVSENNNAAASVPSISSLTLEVPTIY